MRKKNYIFNRVAIIGMGLIGSSLSCAIKRKKISRYVSATAASDKTIRVIRKLKLANKVSNTAKEAVQDADLIIICTPISAYSKIIKEIKNSMMEDAILTDVGSVKQATINCIKPHLPKKITFIPGHPIAGTEESGPRSGFAELFDGRWCILTPLKKTDKKKLKKLTKFWKKCGSRVALMNPKQHDSILAITSHLPHLIAYNIVGTASNAQEIRKSDVIKYSASGFRDFTRLASSDPTMWRDIFLNNKKPILNMLSQFSKNLKSLQKGIKSENGKMLFNFFLKTKRTRAEIIKAGQEIDQVNFGRKKSKKRK